VCGLIAAPAEVNLAEGLAAIAHRGPDAWRLICEDGISMGHARLAVQDLSRAAEQPFAWGPVTLAFNGELFNAPQLKAILLARDPELVLRTTGDTEVLAIALAVLGPQRALPLLNGMFAVAWADTREPGRLFAARDRFGEVPLHVHGPVMGSWPPGKAPRGTGWGPVIVASELKAFRAMGLKTRPHEIMDVPPGHWLTLDREGLAGCRAFADPVIPEPAKRTPALGAPGRLRAALETAARRRAVADIPVCTLLSGGIDSAVIALELKALFPGLVAYTAVMDPGSPDLRAAREVAAELGISLREVIVPSPSATDLARVVDVIEMPFKAQVEIGWPCLHLAEAMARDGFRVTYSGEGADELFGSYGFSEFGIRAKGWDGYRRDIIAAQAIRNFPRVNKAFAAHGVEARLPFLDPGVVYLVMAMDRETVQSANSASGRKAVLQRAYQGDLPERILRRGKLAFQDGLGMREAAASAVHDPQRFYRAEYRRAYG
jgi:asparagine synthase (glutamine-hydrolysing)